MKNAALTRSGNARLQTAGAVSTRRTGAFDGLRREETIAGHLFLLPNLVGFLIFSLVPIIATSRLALTDWNLGGSIPATAVHSWKLASTPSSPCAS